MKKTYSPLQVYFKLMLYRPLLYGLNGFIWICIHLFPLVPGLLIKEYFDHLTNETTLNIGLWGIIALFVSFSFARCIFIFFGFKTDITHRFNIGALLRRNLLHHMIKNINMNELNLPTGEILSNYRDDVTSIEDAISWFLDIIGTFLFALFALIILLSVDVKITIFVFGPLVIVLIIGHSFSKRIHHYRIESRKATAKVTGAIGETFRYIQAIKVSSSEDTILNHIKTLNQDRHKTGLRDTLFNQILDSIYFNTVNIGTGLILLLSAQTMKTGNFSVGDFSLFVSYLAFVSDFILFFGYFIARYQQIKVSIGRLQGLLLGDLNNQLVEFNPLYLDKITPKVTYTPLNEEDTFYSLEVRDLTYTYPDSTNGIKDIQFKIERGSFTVITGQIGAGKSTLLKVLLGLLPKKQGEVYYNAEEIMNLSEKMSYPRVSYTPQVPKLFSDTVRQNILLGLNEDEEAISKAIYQAVLEEDINQLDKGLETIIGPRGVKLSGGQKQRVAASRMFIRDVELYILDDISSALDVETEKKLWERLIENNQKTCLVVSNKRIALENASQIIVLKNGEIESIGTLKELLQTSDEIKKIWN